MLNFTLWVLAFPAQIHFSLRNPNLFLARSNFPPWILSSELKVGQLVVGFFIRDSNFAQLKSNFPVEIPTRSNSGPTFPEAFQLLNSGHLFDSPTGIPSLPRADPSSPLECKIFPTQIQLSIVISKFWVGTFRQHVEIYLMNASFPSSDSLLLQEPQFFPTQIQLLPMSSKFRVESLAACSWIFHSGFQLRPAQIQFPRRNSHLFQLRSNSPSGILISELKV